MWVRVLGLAAGGGFPQWNCNCPNCRDAGDGWLPCRPRTQSSIAISADYERWFLLNASPDVGGQIAAFPALWPRESVRHTPIQAVVLTDTELDHTLGLLSLREGRYVRVYATDRVHTALNMGNPLLRTLGAYCRVDWQPLRLGQTLVLSGPADHASDILCQVFSTFTRKANRLRCRGRAVTGVQRRFPFHRRSHRPRGGVPASSAGAARGHPRAIAHGGVRLRRRDLLGGRRAGETRVRR